MKHSRHSLEQIFQTQVATLSLTLQPFTIVKYEYVARHFVGYLRADLSRGSSTLTTSSRSAYAGLVPLALRVASADRQSYARDNVCSVFAVCWTIWPLKATTSSPVSLSAKTFRRLPEYLPRPLSPEDDHRLQDELRRTDDLYSNALLLTRATGIRIGECIHLTARLSASAGT